jgi:hypothetical protein
MVTGTKAGHRNCPKYYTYKRLMKPTDMTIHWKALEEHFLMAPLVFRLIFEGKMYFFSNNLVSLNSFSQDMELKMNPCPKKGGMSTGLPQIGGGGALVPNIKFSTLEEISVLSQNTLCEDDRDDLFLVTDV